MTSDYLIVIDLDGTLLPKNKKIPLLTKRYIRSLIKKGYNIVLASGRPARNIKVFYEQLGLKTPIISLNGIHIHYPIYDIWLSHYTLLRSRIVHWMIFRLGGTRGQVSGALHT